MAGIVYDLIEVLEDQRECYEGLLTLAKYKKDAVVEKQIELLTQVVEREETFIGRVQLLDKKREGILKDIAFILGAKYESLTIAEIISKISKDQEATNKLTEVRNQLKKIMDELQMQNTINKQILTESMDYTQFTINAIKTTRLSNVPVTYGKPGQTTDERARSLFDHRQ